MPSAHAGLIGSTVTYEYLDPVVTNVADTMGPAVISSTTSFDDTNGFAAIDTTFTDTQIIITNLCQCSYPAVSFEGPSYLFSGTTISSVTIDPASGSDYKVASLSFTSDDIMVNFATISPGIGVPQGEQLILDVAVPEPATVTLLGSALIAVFGFVRRREIRGRLLG